MRVKISDIGTISFILILQFLWIVLGIELNIKFGLEDPVMNKNNISNSINRIRLQLVYLVIIFLVYLVIASYLLYKKFNK